MPSFWNVNFTIRWFRTKSKRGKPYITFYYNFFLMMPHDQCSIDCFLNIKYKVLWRICIFGNTKLQICSIKPMTIIWIPDSKLDPWWVVLQTVIWRSLEQGSGDFRAQPAKMRPFTTSTGFFMIWPVANLLPFIWTGQYPYIWLAIYIFFQVPANSFFIVMTTGQELGHW